MQKHWTSFLPKADTTIVHQGTNQMALDIEISDLAKRLHIARTRWAQAENQILVKAQEQWTCAEIDEAKAESIITQLQSRKK